VDLDSQQEAMDISQTSQRRSARTPKPVLKEKPAYSSDSEDDADAEKKVTPSKKRGKAAKKTVKKAASKTAKPVQNARKRKPAPKKPAVAAKKSKKDKEAEGNDDKGNMDDVNDDDLIDFDGNYGPIDDPNWKAPDYKNKEWFNKNCFTCQICKKDKFTDVNDANNCFIGHKQGTRCYLCFEVITGEKKNWTRKLFQHYQLRHPSGDKKNSVKCPFCDETVWYPIVSHHVAAEHFPIDGKLNILQCLIIHFY